MTYGAETRAETYNKEDIINNLNEYPKNNNEIHTG